MSSLSSGNGMRTSMRSEARVEPFARSRGLLGLGLEQSNRMAVIVRRAVACTTRREVRDDDGATVRLRV
jgi:hypothetical protein